MKKFLYVLLVSGLFSLQADKDFIQSFVNHYDFSAQGRYTHEYHPFLLKQTRESLQQLEDTLQKKGFSVDGRIMIMGYQQEGIPSYHSCCTDSILDDEAQLKLAQGRTVPAHNMFGFLTGFLFKDVNWLQKKLYPHQSLCIQHINDDCISLFSDDAYLFQKHAFGKNFDNILKERDALEKIVKTRNLKNIVQFCGSFWKAIFDGELMSADQEVLATQDILFSVGFAQHLLQTKIPLAHMYVGPDITYPIEILPAQEQKATKNAQDFVKQLVPTLQAHDNKKTVYVFCSFVDGVGKSTLLGNVINYARHADAIEKYEHVDNSSSQRATLYSLRDDVFILDLPAQLSHWVSKPDGHVFIDMAFDVDKKDTEELNQLVDTHKNLYEESFLQALQNGAISGNVFYDYYVDNIRHAGGFTVWIPFVDQDQVYLFNKDDRHALKRLVPLEGVQSRGLKVPYVEQMLFSKGLLLPMRYQSFIDDVVMQLQKVGIEKIVFIDFLSMYPRSSRENVRINFLIQQMQKIFPDTFSLKNSLYHHFINHGLELYHALSTNEEKFIESLVAETLLRTTLYRLFSMYSDSDVCTLGYDKITAIIQREVQEVERVYGSYIRELVRNKVQQEKKALEKYSYDKNYEVFIKFSFDPLVTLSSRIQTLCSTLPGQLADLWGDFSLEVSRKLGVYNHACKDSVELIPLFQLLRAQWYIALANIPSSLVQKEHDEIMYQAAPVMLQKYDQKIVVYQKMLDPMLYIPCYPTKTMHVFYNYVSPKDVEWGSFNDQPYCLDWKRAQTYYGIYAYGYDHRSPSLCKEIFTYQKKMSEDGFDNVAMPTTYLKKLLDQKNSWQEIVGNIPKNKLKEFETFSQQAKIMRLWVRTIATLEMYLKDPQVHIIVRKNNKEDFAAALELIERITLPKYFGLTFKGPLFEDYEAVEPVV